MLPFFHAMCDRIEYAAGAFWMPLLLHSWTAARHEERESERLDYLRLTLRLARLLAWTQREPTGTHSRTRRRNVEDMRRPNRRKALARSNTTDIKRTSTHIHTNAYAHRKKYQSACARHHCKTRPIWLRASERAKTDPLPPPLARNSHHFGTTKTPPHIHTYTHARERREK